MEKDRLIGKMITAAAGLMLALCICTASYAETLPDSGGLQTKDNRLVLEKSLDAYNSRLRQVASPGFTWIYTIEPAEVPEGTVVIDGKDTPVYPGTAGGLSVVKNPSFERNSSLNAAHDYAGNISELILETDLSRFSEPGIYRYLLTDTTTEEDYAAAGVIDSTDNASTYVDVYIVMNKAETALEVAGYTHGTDKDGNGILEKVTLEEDLYRTENIEIEKRVTGNAGDTEHQFPFTAEISNGGLYYHVKKGAEPTASDEKMTGESQSTSLAHGESFYIYGLTENATVKVAETNDTDDLYVADVSDGEKLSLAPGETVSSAEGSCAQFDNHMVFTNHLEEISPTGIIMRYGPYIGMIAAAVLLLAVRKRIKQ